MFALVAILQLVAALHAGTAGNEGGKKSDPTAKPAAVGAQKGSLELGRSANFPAADATSGWVKARRASFSIPAEVDV